MSGRRINAIAIAGVLGLTVQACGGPTYTPKPFVASTATPTATPTPTAEREAAPQLPAGIDQPSKAAATAYVRHYLDVLGYAARTGDTEALTPLAAPSCTACAQATSAITAVYESGGHIEGRGYALSEVTAARRRGDRVRLAIRMQLYAQRTYDASSTAPTRSTQDDTLDARFVVQWSGATPTIARWITTA